MNKLAIIITHPIQYYAPVFAALGKLKDIEVKIFYTWGENSLQKYDPGFGKSINWDIPLLDGYDYEFLENTAKNPGSHHKGGIINPNIIQTLQSYHPTAILVYGWAYQSHLKVLRSFKGKVPIWFRGDSTLLNEKKGIKSRLKYLFLSWVYQHVDIAFYVGSFNKKYFLKYGLKENQLIFAPHAVNNEFFEELMPVYPDPIRTALNIGQDDILILFAAKFEPVKNPMLLLESFLKLRAENVHLLMVGNGVLEEQLKLRILTENKLSSNPNLDKIHFMDFQNQSQMPQLYHSCDLYCLPSVSETWGLAINEAMAAGKAILASDKVGSAIDLIEEGKNGAIFESGNQDELKAKLENLCSSKNNLKMMGSESKRIIQNWSISNQVEVLYQQLLNL